MHAAWLWVIHHWKLWGIATTAATMIGGLVRFFYNLQKSRTEARLAKLRLQQEELAVQTTSLAQILCIYASVMQQIEHSQHLVFSEDELRHAVGKDAPRLHAALGLLMKQGRAKKGPWPGSWEIN